MIPQSKAKLFPAEERGRAQSDGFKSLYSFSFGQYQHKDKTPFGALHALNDDVLAPQQWLSFVAECNMYLVLIPVIGAVKYVDVAGMESELVAGYVQMFPVRSGASFAVCNIYKDEAVRFLQLWIATDNLSSQETDEPAEVDLDANINQLTTVISHPQFAVSLGKFSGREEGNYTMRNSSNGIFAFMIDGQMEIQYRLLQSGDGMGLWEQSETEWEALSASAILLLMEVKL